MNGDFALLIEFIVISVDTIDVICMNTGKVPCK